MSEENKKEYLASSALPGDINTSRESDENIEYEFAIGMPKTALVFEDGDDDEAATEPVIEEAADPLPEPEPESAPEPEHKEEQNPIRTEKDEEFNIPDIFALNGETTVPFDMDKEPMIWKTYLPGFTEASEKRYKFIDEEEARRRETIKRAKMEQAVNLGSSQKSSYKKPSEPDPEPVSQIEIPEVDVTAEIDKGDSLGDAVIVNTKGPAKENPDAISVFKFEEEKTAPEESAPELSEEELEREKISSLVDRKIEEPEIEEIFPEATVSVDELIPEPVEKKTENREIPHPASPFKEVYTASPVEELPENERPEGHEKRLDVSAKGGSEYTYFTQRERFKDKFLDMIMSVRLRAIVSSILAVVLFVFEAMPLFSDGFYKTIGLMNPFAVGGVDVLIILALFVLAIPEAVGAIDYLRRGVVTPEISVILSAVVIAVYTFVSSAGGAYPVLLGSVYAVLVLSSIFASYNMLTANFIAFKTISEKGQKRVIDVRHTRSLERENMSLDGVIDESKSKIARDFNTSFISDFFKNSSRRQENNKGNILILALTYGIALVLGLVMFFIGDGLPTMLASFATVICLATPAFSMLSHKLPYKHGQSELASVSAAVVGEEAFYEADGVNVVTFEDTEIFGEDDVTFKSISLSNKDGDFRRAMKMMSQLFAALGGPLSAMFTKSLGKTFAPAEKIVIEDDGAQGVIDGVTVMAGSAEYMKRKGISVPIETGYAPASLKTMYAAEGGVLFAKFSIQYSFSEDFAHMLSAMRERNIIPLVYTRDPNISNELLRFLTGAKDCIRVMKKHSVAPPSEKVYQALSTRLAVLGEKIDTVNLLLVANKYSGLQSGIALTELAASLVGAVLACLIVICNMTAALSSSLIAIWQIAWCVALFFMSKSSFKSSKKRKK